MSDINKIIKSLDQEVINLFKMENFEIIDVDSKEGLSKKEIQEILGAVNLKKEFSPFYKTTNGYLLKWKNTNTKSYGSLNILSLDQMLNDEWNDMITDSYHEKNNISKFRVFDFYSNQNYTGLFLDNYENEGLYYVRELTGYPIKLKLESYFELAAKIKGIEHWPSLIVKWLYDISLIEFEDLKSKIEDTFPEFNLEQFKNDYYNSKI